MPDTTRILVIEATTFENVHPMIDDQEIEAAVEAFADWHSTGHLFDTVTHHWETHGIEANEHVRSIGHVVGYGIGYFYGRQVGDSDLLRAELTARFGESSVDNLEQYAGAKAGYSDGVNDCEREVRDTAIRLTPIHASNGDHEGGFLAGVDLPYLDD